MNDRSYNVEFGALVWIVVLLLIHVPGLSALDNVYHSSSEIEFELESLADAYSEWMIIDSIGHSSQYGLPVYLAKLSDNPEDDEPEPSILFIGQMHGEEVIGVEIVMALINSLLSTIDSDSTLELLENSQFYFIPTANPEGLDIVHSGIDSTFRKNCRDNIGDDRFRYREGIGGDTSGVDINRNFGLHWDRGDTLLQPRGDAEIYNYYRGPSPFSEPETQALRDLAVENRFLFSISYHSSRSGRNAEKVIAPWSWDGKDAPDNSSIDALGEKLADLIPRSDRQGSYEYVHSTQRNGQAQDWFYQATGTYQYLIEVGRDIQPDSASLFQIVDDNFNSVMFLMKLAVGSETIEEFGILSIHASDAVNDRPLTASIRIPQLDDPVLEQRRTSPITGMFDRLVPVGSYQIDLNSTGYHRFSSDSILIREGERSDMRVELEPRETYDVFFESLDRNSRTGIASFLKLKDTLSGSYEFSVPAIGMTVSLPDGLYEIESISHQYLPHRFSYNVTQDDTVLYTMNPANVLFNEDFVEDGGWTRGGANEDWGIIQIADSSYLTESESGNYLSDTDSWLELEVGEQLNPLAAYVIEMVHQPYFEPGSDFGILEVTHSESGDILSRSEFSSFPSGWDTTRVYLNTGLEGEIILRLLMKSDDRLEENGWLIDRITLYEERDPRFVREVPIPTEHEPNILAFPNPFNSSTVINMDLPVDMTIRIGLYNTNGRFIKELSSGFMPLGEHRFSLSGYNLPSGNYHLISSTPNGRFVLPLTILR